MASTTTIAKYKLKSEQAQKRARTLAKRVPLRLRMAQRMGTLLGAGAAFGMGALQRNKSAPPTFGLDVEPSLLYGAVLATAGELVDGRGGEYLRSAGHGLLIASAYRWGASGAIGAQTTNVSGYGGTDPFAVGYSVFDDGDDDDGPDEGQL